MAKRTALERFYEKTVRDPSGCLLWIASTLPKGYGRFGDAHGSHLAHRWIFERTHGVRLSRLQFVLHSCDTPGCVEIDHLRVGTAKENTADMDRRGRRPRIGPSGGLNSHARLTEDQVREVRVRHEQGETMSALGLDFGVGVSAISRIVKRQNWKHVA